jgi:prepilin-type N-terminal cleavage/methylation domain-containing protein
MTTMRARGVTMPELMITLVIIAILASVATVAVKRDPVGDRTRTVTALLQEAHRKAVALGPIFDANGTPLTLERTCVRFTTDVTGSWADLFQRIDDNAGNLCTNAPNDSWVQLGTQYMRPDANAPIIWAVDSVAQDIPTGAIPAQLNGSVAKTCYPNGTCDAMTVYVAKRNASGLADGDHFRIIVFPLSGVPTTLKGW